MNQLTSLCDPPLVPVFCCGTPGEDGPPVCGCGVFPFRAALVHNTQTMAYAIDVHMYVCRYGTYSVYILSTVQITEYLRKYAPQRAHQMCTLYQRYLLTVLVDIRSVQCVCTILCIQKYVQ